MNFSGKGMRNIAMCAFLLMSGMICHGQGFPMRSGVWDATVSASNANIAPMKIQYCLNDATWAKALSMNKACKMDRLSVGVGGLHYYLRCKTVDREMKGPVQLSFDGKEHMTQKASMELTTQGHSINAISTVDYRWKSATCTGKESNMKAVAAPPRKKR